MRQDVLLTAKPISGVWVGVDLALLKNQDKQNP